LWVFLSFFYPNLNYQNNLLVDYEYSEVMLSSSGFSLGRTGWGIAIFFVSLFFINFLKSNLLKTIIFILGFLSVCTTGSRGGELYFFLSILFYIGYYLKDLKVKILFFVAMFLFFGYIYFSLGEVLRLSNNDDFFNGRIISREVVYRLLTDHFLFGYYSVGGYSLDSFGVGYKEIHNAWLNFFIKYGLLGSIPMFLFLGYGLKGIFHNKKYFKDNLSLYLIIIVGIVSTFLEPETIFSYGYHILIFWFTLGYLSKNKTC
ncbi:O-antigen ligase family protein, partial [Acinetobacter baumannii]